MSNSPLTKLKNEILRNRTEYELKYDFFDFEGSKQEVEFLDLRLSDIEKPLWKAVLNGVDVRSINPIYLFIELLWVLDECSIAVTKSPEEIVDKCISGIMELTAETPEEKIDELFDFGYDFRSFRFNSYYQTKKVSGLLQEIGDHLGLVVSTRIYKGNIALLVDNNAGCYGGNSGRYKYHMNMLNSYLLRWGNRQLLERIAGVRNDRY